MPSPLRPRNVVIFLLINILVSALTAFIVVRAVTQAANRTVVAPAAAAADPGLTPTAAPAADAATSPAPISPVAVTQSSVLVAADPTAAPVPTLASVAATAPATAPAAPPSSPAVPAGPADVRISTVVFPGQRTREAVVIVNEGEQANMTGWTLSNPRGQTYTFGNVLLFRDSFINLHTTSGVDVPTDVFWNLDQAVWQAGDVATLKRGDEVMATFTIR